MEMDKYPYIINSCKTWRQQMVRNNNTGTHDTQISCQRQSHVSSAAMIEKQERESHKTAQENVRILAQERQVCLKGTQDFCTI